MKYLLLLLSIILVGCSAPNVKPKNIEDIYTVTRYGQHEFCSSIKLDNVFGCQFHPEKSGPRGLKFLQNYFS